ncbi:hypothetical protein H2201_005602 [Coniosporium apollinis]|uniref:Phosphatidylglycerol/phosphatidylinositol transfer protein n=1 Tax=Coniosporium apollinis TaxID=61459 RepID=A0ABQ9NVS0_9PEZI|nr:hypothetical protein H2201_005602 [Coniosporium apollinis]
MQLLTPLVLLALSAQSALSLPKTCTAKNPCVAPARGKVELKFVSKNLGGFNYNVKIGKYVSVYFDMKKKDAGPIRTICMPDNPLYGQLKCKLKGEFVEELPGTLTKGQCLQPNMVVRGVKCTVG